MKNPQIQQLVESNGFTTIANTPEEFAKTLRDDIELNQGLVRKYPDIR